MFESLLNGRRSLGCDTNPVAVCLSRAKADSPTQEEVLKRLTLLEERSKSFRSQTAETDDEFFRLCFHENTLRQILFLKKKLDWRGDCVDRFISALALGCLHGESHRTELCFSNRMPRTISTKPAYSVSAGGAQKNVSRRNESVFPMLRTCTEFRFQSPRPPLKGRVVEGDVRRAATLLRPYQDRVKLAVTSAAMLGYHGLPRRSVAKTVVFRWPAQADNRAGKDSDRSPSPHRSLLAISSNEAWNGIAPLLQSSAQVVIRDRRNPIGGGGTSNRIACVIELYGAQV